MAAPFLLGFTPIISAPSIDVDTWDVQAEVDDPTERYSGFDVSVGDVVFLDLRSSTTSPDTAGRYTVETILARTATSLRVVLAWGGDGAGIDPVEGAGHRGYMTRGSNRNSLAWHPSPRVLMVPQELVDLAKNAETFIIIDRFSTAGSGSSVDQVARDRQVRAVLTPRSFTIGQVVTTRAGLADLACPQIDARMPAAGIALGMGAGTVLVQGSGVITNPVFSFTPGLPVFVSDAGGLTQDPETISRPGWLQLMGMALDVSTISLNITGQMTKRW